MVKKFYNQAYNSEKAAIKRKRARIAKTTLNRLSHALNKSESGAIDYFSAEDPLAHITNRLANDRTRDSGPTVQPTKKLSRQERAAANEAQKAAQNAAKARKVRERAKTTKLFSAKTSKGQLKLGGLSKAILQKIRK